jgi:hypothetical protein
MTAPDIPVTWDSTMSMPVPWGLSEEPHRCVSPRPRSATCITIGQEAHGAGVSGLEVHSACTY